MKWFLGITKRSGSQQNSTQAKGTTPKKQALQETEFTKTSALT
jgi:hypothetical protein